MALVVCLAGRSGLEEDGVAVADPGLGRLGRVALAFMVAERHRPVDRHELAEVLGGSDCRPRGSRRSAPSDEAARSVSQRGGLPDDVLVARDGCYQLPCPTMWWSTSRQPRPSWTGPERRWLPAIRLGSSPGRGGGAVAERQFLPGSERGLGRTASSGASSPARRCPGGRSRDRGQGSGGRRPSRRPKRRWHSSRCGSRPTCG